MEKFRDLYKSNEFKILVPTLIKQFGLLVKSYSASGIQDYVEYIIKNIIFDYI